MSQNKCDNTLQSWEKTLEVFTEFTFSKRNLASEVFLSHVKKP